MTDDDLQRMNDAMRRVPRSTPPDPERMLHLAFIASAVMALVIRFNGGG